MIKPKYEVGYVYTNSQGFDFEIIEKNFTGSIVIYYVKDLTLGFIGILTEKELDHILGGSNAKKPRKK